MRFEWDPAKNEANRRKHGLAFANAAEVFEGPVVCEVDGRYDYGETRWVGIGLLRRGTTVVVIYTEPAEDVIRIISARKAKLHERAKYFGQLGQ